VHAELVGIERLGGDVGDELVGGAIVVFVVVVAQREIPELHFATLHELDLPRTIFSLPRRAE
jgi:hypothetical protein